MAAYRHQGDAVTGRRQRLAARATVMLTAPVLAGAVLTGAVLAGAPASAATGAAAGSAACPGSTGLGPRVPVLLVHGFSEDSQVWSSGGSHSMIAAIRTVAGVRVVPPFDYGPVNTNWVTDPSIGAALAARIRCLAKASPIGTVIVVGHSMGGLATRCAFQQACVGTGRPVAQPSQVGLVITLGTPNLGSPLAGWQKSHPTPARAPSLAPGTKVHAKPAGGLLSGIPDILAGLCESWARCRDSFPVAANSPAAAAMKIGSPQLKAVNPGLAPLPAAVPLYAIAGKITVSDTLFYRQVNPAWDAGDGVVLENSALAEAPPNGALTGPHAGPGSGQDTIDCGSAPLTELALWNPGPLAGLRSVTCWHLTETTSPAFQADVVRQITAYIAHSPAAALCPYLSASQAAAAAGGPVTGVPPVRVSAPIIYWAMAPPPAYPLEACVFNGPQAPAGMYRHKWSMGVSLTQKLPDAQGLFLATRKSAAAYAARLVPSGSPQPKLLVVEMHGLGTDAFVVPPEVLDGEPVMYVLIPHRIVIITIQPGYQVTQAPPGHLWDAFTAAGHEVLANLQP